MAEMNIYEKIQAVKVGLLEANLKKTGENPYSRYKYYELSDFLPTVVKLCSEHKLFTKVTFNEEVATLQIINAEKPEEEVIYDSPMRAMELKGCNAVQALGGVQTYQRRYLYQAAFDITENDMFDAAKENEEIYRCCDCGNECKSFTDTKGQTWTAKQVFEEAKKLSHDGKPRCAKCRQALEQKQKQQEVNDGE